MQRRKSREICLQILFQREFNSDFQLDHSINYFKTHHNIDDAVLSFSKTLAFGVIHHAADIDQIINSNSRNWKTSRMSSVDINILRMAIFEALLLEPKNEPKIVINESLEIAKKYSSLDSHNFINGILDQAFKMELGGMNS